MASVPPKNHYQVLGVTEEATHEEIKAEYRRLVRLHHPDVSQAPNAAEQFRELAHAYEILSDPLQRSNLDAELLLYRSRLLLNGPRFPESPFEAPPRQPDSRSGPAPTPFTITVDRASEARKAELQAIKYAQECVESGRAKARFHPREALDLAKRALKANPRSAEAAELAGQMYERMDRDDEALSMYTIAIQCDPRNTNVKKAFSRLSGIKERRPTPPPRSRQSTQPGFWAKLFKRS